MGMSNAYDWEHSDPYELENRDIGKTLSEGENIMYRECNVDWDHSSCKQAHDALIAFLMQVYPELSQNDLKAIARVKEERMRKWQEAIHYEKKGLQLVFAGGLGFKDSFVFDPQAAQVYEARELGRVEAHIK